MSTDFPYAGSISHGTHRTVDLVPAFLDVLRDLDPSAAAIVDEDYSGQLREIYGHAKNASDDYVDGDAELLTILVDALDNRAPEGYYFGAHEGDGADFGFWPTGDPQNEALVRMVEQRGTPTHLNVSPFDLPAGYILVRFSDGFTCGISPEGDVSS
jgi:hypothetical protein